MKRRLLFASFGALLLGIAFFLFAIPAGPRYRAESLIIVTPYTNAVFARSFQAMVISAIPGVLRLELAPVRTSMTPGATNGAGIRIIAFGESAAGAHLAATNAAARLCVMIHDLYGSTGELVDTTDRSRRYSFFHDGLQPKVTRMFKP